MTRLFKIFKLLFLKTKTFYNILGLKIRLTGKLSVTGNARTRSIYFQIGLTNKSNLKTQVDYSFASINTDTGCLGLSV
jgi:ribosomal protein S3